MTKSAKVLKVLAILGVLTLSITTAHEGQAGTHGNSGTSKRSNLLDDDVGPGNCGKWCVTPYDCSAGGGPAGATCGDARDQCETNAGGGNHVKCVCQADTTKPNYGHMECGSAGLTNSAAGSFAK